MTIHYAHWNAVGIRVAISLRELDSIGLSAVCVCSRRKLNGMKEKMKRTMQSIKWKRAPLKKLVIDVRIEKRESLCFCIHPTKNVCAHEIHTRMHTLSITHAHKMEKWIWYAEYDRTKRNGSSICTMDRKEERIDETLTFNSESIVKVKRAK